MSISRDEVERARLVSEYKYAVDTQSKVVHARREGLRKGRREGENSKAREIARNLKSIGIPAGQIARVTGLTGEQIKDL
jgi:predicted transposase/invertase (TIGR01784 family)